MEKKTIGLIATIGTVFICACPSLIACGFGVAGISGIPFTTTVNGYESVQPMNSVLAISLLCLAVIGLAIPIVIGFFTLRKKPEDTAINAAPMTSPAMQSDPFNNDEPLPPAS